MDDLFIYLPQVLTVDQGFAVQTSRPHSTSHGNSLAPKNNKIEIQKKGSKKKKKKRKEKKRKEKGEKRNFSREFFNLYSSFLFAGFSL